MDVLIVIVNYRSAPLAVDCLRSLEGEVHAHPGTVVEVVENASGDDSAAVIGSVILENGWASWATLRVVDRNGGFAAGNNAAIGPALAGPEPPRYVWLLNPDTIVHPGAMAELVNFLDRRPDVGMAGSQLVERDGTPQQSAFRFPTVLGELEGGLRLGVVSKVLHRHVSAPPVPLEECRVDWVAGASLMVRREVFDAIGLLDDGYFLYFEEVDFCLRSFRAGWPCWYVPSSRVVHLVGQSTGVTNNKDANRRRPRYWFEARARYYLNNHGRPKKIAADATFTLAFAAYRLRRRIQRKPDLDPHNMLWDFVRFNFLPVSR
jgi:GT2 family glycosyltransferase